MGSCRELFHPHGKLLHNDGTLQSWFSVLVVDHHKSVESPWLSTDGARSWQGSQMIYHCFDVKTVSVTKEAAIVNSCSIASNPGAFALETSTKFYWQRRITSMYDVSRVVASSLSTARWVCCTPCYEL